MNDGVWPVGTDDAVVLILEDDMVSGRFDVDK
jgi:hypothetical protein